METVAKKKMYEGMFLVDSARAGSDWEGINTAIERILGRAEAEIVSIRKWDDRRLAYEIKHVGRGTYILAYFRADGQMIEGIEKAVQLSEHILRVLILNAEHMTAEDMEKETPAAKAEKEETTSASAEEAIEEDQEELPDDLLGAPTIEAESEDVDDSAMVEDAAAVDDAAKAEGPRAKDEAGIAEEVQPPVDVELNDEEEESEPKTMADDL